MNILIDVGNSRLKWATEQADNWQIYPALAYRDIDFLDQLLAIWQTLPEPNTLAIASVATDQVKKSVLSLAQQLWPKICLISPFSSAMALGVRNAYQQPEKLGIDRWLALLAAHHYYPGYTCIVDCGTAITIDILNTQGQHLGGFISPGLNLMKTSLSTNTAALNFASHCANTTLATHTTAAIANGTLYAAIGMVEAVLKRLSSPAQLILTGGDAEVLAEHIQAKSIIDAALVLKGLRLLGQSTEQSY